LAHSGGRRSLAELTRAHDQLVRRLVDKADTATQHTQQLHTALAAREAAAAATHRELTQLHAKVRLPSPCVKARALVEKSTRVREGCDVNCLHHDLEVLNNPVPPPSPCPKWNLASGKE
jgi:hypothetical protein